jgi:hypothetical protein
MSIDHQCQKYPISRQVFLGETLPREGESNEQR